MYMIHGSYFGYYHSTSMYAWAYPHPIITQSHFPTMPHCVPKKMIQTYREVTGAWKTHNNMNNKT